MVKSVFGNSLRNEAERVNRRQQCRQNFTGKEAKAKGPEA